MAVGSSQSLTFNTGGGANTAVHGGGSCQISITYETDPTAIKDPSNWKVLYSIEGGCPTNSPLNLDGNYVGTNGQSYTGAIDCSDPTTNGYDCVNSFNFTIPQGVKNGQATLAWTWFNNVGNREIYMNCIAADITGGASDASQMAGLPNMFVANLASVNGGTCKTTEMTAVKFPDPGQYVTTKVASSRMPVATAKDYPLAVPSGCGNVVSSPSGNTSAAGGSAPSSTAAAATSVAAQPSTLSTATSSPAAGKGVANTSVPQAATSTSNAPVGTDGAASPTIPATQGACAAGSVSCAGAAIGSLVCMDATHYGICDYGNCAVVMAVADGTTCTGGAIGFASSKKEKRRPHRAIRRRA